GKSTPAAQNPAHAPLETRMRRPTCPSLSNLMLGNSTGPSLKNLSIKFELKYDFENLLCICGLKSKLINEHIKHVTSHISGPFTCPDCVNKFSSSQCLEFHQYLVHKRRTDSLEICISSCFEENYPLYSFLSDIILCPCCGYKISNDFELHMNTHLTGNYHCPICSIYLQSFQDVEIHIKFLHFDFLESYVSRIKLMIKRKENDTELISYSKCDICNIVFENTHSFRSHKYIKHPEHYPFSCLLCNLSFSSRLEMDNHSCPQISQDLVIVENNEENVNELAIHKQCSICQYICKSNISLQRHLRESHANCETPSFNCPVCDLVLNNRKALSDHLRCHKHNGFPCKFCHARLQTVDSLNVHINEIHTHEIQYQCKYCSQAFFSSGRLSYHIKRHHTDRCSYPNLCHLCGKTYPYPSELRHHLRSHRDERIYKCDNCDKSFLKQGDLTYHKRKHTGEKPHKCPYCDLRFPRPNTLKSHIRVIHPLKISSVGKKPLELKAETSMGLNSSTQSQIKTDHQICTSAELPISNSSSETTTNLTLCDSMKSQSDESVVNSVSVRQNTSEARFATVQRGGEPLGSVVESDHLVVDGPVTHLQPVEYVELDSLPDGTELQPVQVV
ncbi:unnamed protein product, partial [Meganyctiphanes norvegica]